MANTGLRKEFKGHELNLLEVLELKLKKSKKKISGVFFEMIKRNHKS